RVGVDVEAGAEGEEGAAGRDVHLGHGPTPQHRLGADEEDAGGRPAVLGERVDGVDAKRPPAEEGPPRVCPRDGGGGGGAHRLGLAERLGGGAARAVGGEGGGGEGRARHPAVRHVEEEERGEGGVGAGGAGRDGDGAGVGGAELLLQHAAVHAVA